MKDMIPNRKEKGFTLIELVMVIVILGILAAFALPRFADLGGEAERASIDGARGAVKSAIGIVRSTALAQGKGDVTTSDATSDDETVVLEGENISLVEGHLAAASVEDVAQLGDFYVASDGSLVAISDEADKPCFNFSEATVDSTTGNLTAPARVSNIGSTGDDPSTCDGAFN